MTVVASQRAGQELAASLADFDFNRPPSVSPRAPFKQWVHTTVWHPEITIAFNFSSVYAGKGVDHRLSAIVYAREVVGHVRRFQPEACRVPVGRPTLVFGPNKMSRLGAEYDIELFEPALDLQATLTLRATTHASTLQGSGTGSENQMGWSVVPRLVASGSIQFAGRRFEVENAPAYRDRNWGCFAFGDVSWDWIYALPSDAAVPWAVVVSRVTDRTRSFVSEQSLLLWRDREVFATFRDADLTLRGERPLEQPIPTIPAPLALCVAGEATDVPRTMRVEAKSSRGSLRLTFESESVARLVVPNDGRLGMTAIYESLGAITMDGIVDGHDVALEGHGFLECLHA
jgi:hypothetical protein